MGSHSTSLRFGCGRALAALRSPRAAVSAGGVHAAVSPPGKEIAKGYRWVAITGTIDHAKMLANYRQVLKTLRWPTPITGVSIFNARR